MNKVISYLLGNALALTAAASFAQSTTPITLTINALNVKINAKDTACKSVVSKYFPADSKLEISTDDPACTGTVVPGVTPPTTGGDQLYQGTVWAAYERRLSFPAKGQANPLVNVNLFFTDGSAPLTTTLTTRPPGATNTVYVRYKIETYSEPPNIAGAQFAVDYAAPLTEGILVFPGSVPDGFSAIAPVQQQLPITLLYNQQGNKGLKLTLQEINSGRSQPTKDKIVDSVFYIFKDDVGTTPPVVLPPVVVPPVVVPPVVVPPVNGTLKTCISMDGNNQPVRDINGNIVNLPCGTDSTDPTIIASIPNPSWTMNLQLSAVTRQPINAYVINPTAPATNCGSATPPITRAFMHNIDFATTRLSSGRDVFTLAPNSAMIYGITVPNLAPGAANQGSISLNVSETFGPQAPQFVSITKAPCDFDTSKVGNDACYYSTSSTTGDLYYRIGGVPSPTEAFVPKCVLTPGEKYFINVRFQNAMPATIDPRTTGYPREDSCSRSLVGTNASQCATFIAIR